MYVVDKDDSTTTKIGESLGDTSSSEKWEVQQAWDKQATFLQAQSRAMKTLEGLIRQYDELLHKDWDAASEEQKARIEALKANTERLRKDSGEDMSDEGVEIINDAPKETGADIGNSDTEVSSDIQ